MRIISRSGKDPHWFKNGFSFQVIENTFFTYTAARTMIYLDLIIEERYFSFGLPRWKIKIKYGLHCQSWVFEAFNNVFCIFSYWSKHTCQLCGYQALQKTNMKLHEQAVYDGKRFQCPEFDHMTTHKGDLTSHQKSLNMVQKYQCPKCKFQANRKGSLARHNKSVHMDLNFQCS